ncbi:NUDIX hydrolase [Pleomorphovibrio marinus]|uniref:NUDIX hydrolase n=1 Tax=Pleomorphovibrio marinus TaxID=2164132 RepID=UPI000E0B047E|nr:NUDIX domain-containing protein [Pleomorphovibrio marinus]
MKEEIKPIKTKDEPNLIPHLTIDCVVFGFHDSNLKILLLKWKNTKGWSLPGSVVMQEESIDEAAKRILKERTGLKDIFLRQFHTFGEVKRYDLERHRNLLSHLIERNLWYERAISIGYYALVDYKSVFPNPDEFTDDCEWWDLHDLPTLLFDHKQILDKAHHSLRLELNFQPIGYNLLPKKFTMPELQRLYEAILQKKIDPRNFQKKILKTGVVTRLDEVKKGVAHRAPFLYSFDCKKYQQVLEDGGLFFT